MKPSTRRILLRSTIIGVQWVLLTTAVGSLVIRSEASFDRLISPHFGAAPMFLAAFVAALLLGLTVESPRFMVPLVMMMCVTSAAFIGVVSYAPVIDGAIVRTTTLDNWVLQRVVVVAILTAMAAVPGAAAGNLLGSFMNVRHELAPHPEDLRQSEEVPWWEQRDQARSGASGESTNVQ